MHPMHCTFIGAFLAFVGCSAASADIEQEAAQHGDIEVAVTLDAAGQSGSANASVRIHASRQVVWSLITSCAEAVGLVPGLVSCEVLETAPDRSWQRIRHVLNYSWYVPKLTYEIRASYIEPSRVASSAFRGTCGCSRGRGCCRTTETIRSRTTRWNWRPVSGCLAGWCGRLCAATCPGCCARCEPARRGRCGEPRRSHCTGGGARPQRLRPRTGTACGAGQAGFPFECL